ncbi:MAG: hypothetical protein ACI85I_001450 [Arenicella sp.]|jgi:hypothetical protein
MALTDSKEEFPNQLKKGIPGLLKMVRGTCWNQISDNCEFIISEIKNHEDGQDFDKVKKQFLKSNLQKKPKKLNDILPELMLGYDNFHDVDLEILQAKRHKTIINIKYYSKLSINEEFRESMKNENTMLHCHITIPPYASSFSDSTHKKFDVNWHLGGWRYEWNMWLWKMKFRWVEYLREAR